MTRSIAALALIIISTANAAEPTMVMIETLGASRGFDIEARQRCARARYPLMWRLTTGAGERTTFVWCLHSAAGVPEGAEVMETGYERK